jgi:hypothetical protein
VTAKKEWVGYVNVLGRQGGKGTKGAQATAAWFDEIIRRDDEEKLPELLADLRAMVEETA